MTNNYFDDKEYISNSMLNDFFKLTKTWKKYYTPDLYHRLHVLNLWKLVQTEAMKVWSIVDEYFADWVDVFDKYKVADWRTKEGKQLKELFPDICVSQDVMNRVELLINALKQDKTFLVTVKQSEKQAILKWVYEFTDEETWEVVSIKIKGKPDFIDYEWKVIVDLKTTGNFETLLNDMQWQLKPVINHKYFRQLAIYNFLSWQQNDCYLAIADDANTYVNSEWLKFWRTKWIKVRQSILDKALESVFEDIRELYKYQKNNWQSLEEIDIFESDNNLDNEDELWI